MIVVNSRFLTQRITGVQRFSIELSLQIKKKLGSRVLFVSPPNILHNDLAEILEVKVIGTRTGHAWEQLDLPCFLNRTGKPLLLCCGEVEKSANSSTGSTEPYSPYTAGRPAICA